MFGETLEDKNNDKTPQKGEKATTKDEIPKNRAHFLDLPPSGRGSNSFCGLKNQGATCYLNSLIQLYFMSPELRNTILSLPLYKASCDEPTDFVPPDSMKYKILFALQKLFSEMQDLDVEVLTTQQVTESFGWQNEQELVQQDIQEANRVMFDVLERALAGTAFAENIPKFYKGTHVNQLECLSCGLIKEREEHFYDLILQVKGNTSIEESLMSMLQMEKLEGSNQYFCEICNKKVDAYKGIKIRKFPPVLTLSLSRFEFDFTKEDLVKINDSIRFGLELDISLFSEKPELIQNEDERWYELAGVLIHRGSPYSGHYHAYIRDLLKEGNWQKRFADSQAQKEQVSKKEDDKKKDTETSVVEEKEKPLAEKVQETKELEEQSTDEEEKDAGETQESQGRSNKRNRNRRKVNKKKKKGHRSGNSHGKKKGESYDDTIFDNIPFPIEFSNQELSYDWFDFNDSSVTPIPVNRLQAQFGGESTENAYILVYRQRSFSKVNEMKKLKIPEYFGNVISTQNEINENFRKVYKEAESQLEIRVFDSSLINFTEKRLLQGVLTGNKVTVNLNDKFEQVLKMLKVEEPRDFVLVEIQVLKSNLVQFKRVIDLNLFEQTVTDLKVEFWSNWALFRKTDPVLNEAVIPYCGADFIPIRINIRDVEGKETQIVTFQNKVLQDLRQQIETDCGIPLNQQLMILMEGDAPRLINRKEEDDSEQLKEIGLTDNVDILVKMIDAEEVTKHQEQYQKPSKKNKTRNNLNMGGKVENLTTVMIEKDEEEGSIKYYADLEWTLGKLIENIKRKLHVEPGSERRLRKIVENSLFYEEEMTKKLRELNFQDEDGFRLRLEIGKTPNTGSLSLRIKNQSKHKKEKDPEVLNNIGFPDETLADLKERICKELALDPKEHKLYQTDYLQEPAEAFNNEGKHIREAPIKQGDVLVLRDKDTPLPKEVVKLNIYYTKTGFHEDSEYIGLVQVRESQTLQDLKNIILMMPKFALENASADFLRLRELTNNLFFSKILRDNTQNIKSLKLQNDESIAAQLLPQPENLDENMLVLLLQKRIVETQTYTKFEEFVWDAPKEPTIEELKLAVIEFKQLGIGLEEVTLAKYIPHGFKWQEISKEYIEQQRKAKKNKHVKGKNKKKKTASYQTSSTGKENLRQSPYNFKDGDIICYRLETENPEKKDDFQTEEDKQNRKKYEEGKGDDDKKNSGGVGFQIYADF